MNNSFNKFNSDYVAKGVIAKSKRTLYKELSACSKEFRKLRNISRDESPIAHYNKINIYNIIVKESEIITNELARRGLTQRCIAYINTNNKENYRALKAIKDAVFSTI